MSYQGNDRILVALIVIVMAITIVLLFTYLGNRGRRRHSSGCDYLEIGPVSNLQGVRNEDGSVTLTWTAGHDANMYIVSYWEHGPMCSPSIEGRTGSLSYTFTPADQSLSLSIQVRAFREGCGAVSGPATIRID